MPRMLKFNSRSCSVGASAARILTGGRETSLTTRPDENDVDLILRIFVRWIKASSDETMMGGDVAAAAAAAPVAAVAAAETNANKINFKNRKTFMKLN